MNVVFPAFTSRPPSLLATNRSHVFQYSVHVFTQYINIIIVEWKLLCPVELHSLLVNLDHTNGIVLKKSRRAVYIKHLFVPDNVKDECLPIQTSLCFSFKPVSINLVCFMGTTNHRWTLYKTSLLTTSYAFLKSINSWCTAALYSHCFPCIWGMLNIALDVEVLHQTSHSWSP
jgi:hypothetical protein